jgi:hypothetical protein
MQIQRVQVIVPKALIPKESIEVFSNSGNNLFPEKNLLTQIVQDLQLFVNTSHKRLIA